MLRFRLTTTLLFVVVALYPAACLSKSDKPVNISDSQALRMGLDKYMRLVPDDTEFQVNQGFSYYASLRYRANERLMRRLPPAKRRLARQCYNSFSSFEAATWDYCDGAGDACDMLTDTARSTGTYGEELMMRVIEDIKQAKTLPNGKHRIIVSKAWADLHKSYQTDSSQFDSPDPPPMGSKAELVADYHRVESDLRKLEDVLGSLPPKSRPGLIKHIEEVASTPSMFDDTQ